MKFTQKASKSFLEETPSDKVPFGQAVLNAITTNAGLFPNLPFSLPAMQALNSQLSTAIANAKTGTFSEIEERNNIEKAWNTMFGKTANYVTFVAAGNAETITLAGFKPTSAESKPKVKPGPAILKKMTQLDAGVADITMEHPGAGAASAYMYLAIPADAQLSTAADGTITITLAGGQEIYVKCDTHNATTMGGMEAGKALKLVVQPVNNAGAGGTSAPKTFTPQQ